jgi:hypothetical protein
VLAAALALEALPVMQYGRVLAVLLMSPTSFLKIMM